MKVQEGNDFKNKKEEGLDLTSIAKFQKREGLLSRLKIWSHSQILSLFSVGTGCCAREIRRLDGPHPLVQNIREGINHYPIEECDILIVSGIVNKNLAPYLLRAYERMKGPKYCVAVGTCSASGAIFSTMPVEDLFPVDIYIPGCPPSLDALVEGVELLRHQLQGEKNKEKLGRDLREN